MKLINKILVHTRTNLFAATCICLFVLSLVFPVSNLRAEDRPAVILGTSTDRIGTPSGRAIYATASKDLEHLTGLPIAWARTKIRRQVDSRGNTHY